VTIRPEVGAIRVAETFACRLLGLARARSIVGVQIRAPLRENVHYTFGGFNFSATFLNLLLEVGVAGHPAKGRISITNIDC
jgi:hypothetical protein